MFPLHPSQLSSPEQLLEWAIRSFRSRFAVLTSFQKSGMVTVDMAAKIEPSVRVITLDTGRLPEETYRMMEMIREHYGIQVEMVASDAAEVEQMQRRYGPNLFYRDPALRRLCCEVRKVRPQRRKLAELDAYAVGLRRAQTESRSATLQAVQVEGRWKLSPLAEWSNAQVNEYLRRNGVPEHPLYAAGYTSIGCGPCTRAVADGEEERSGRWWWEQDAAKECGLHVTADGVVARKLDVLLGELVSARA